MPNLFQQFLNQVNRGYGQLDKKVFGGALPGGASISSSIAPKIRAVATSPVYKTIRDKAVIPALDFAMEKGVVPAKEGMFARFLSGTSNPLTRIPADTRAAETLVNERLVNPTERDKKLIELKTANQAWLDQYRTVRQQNQMFNMYGTGSPASAQQQQEVDRLKQNVDQLAKNLGMKNVLEYYGDEDVLGAERKVNYDPRNYTMSAYNMIGPRGLKFSNEQEALINKGLVNTLGRYQVEDGRTKGERYDFNSYNVSTPLFAPGSMVGGVIGEPVSSRKLADKALRLADKFGFIQPGAGYPVDFKFR